MFHLLQIDLTPNERQFGSSHRAEPAQLHGRSGDQHAAPRGPQNGQLGLQGDNFYLLKIKKQSQDP